MKLSIFRNAVTSNSLAILPPLKTVDARHADSRRDFVLAEHPSTRRRCGIGTAAMVACVLWLTGCASPKAFMVQRAEPGAVTCSTPVPQHDMLVGVALSGGGSRAALFGAAGLEALGSIQTRNGQSVLEQMSYLSSVSGGSIAATYYALNKPGRNVSVLTPDGAMTDAYREFFSQYRNALSQEFGPAVFWRQISTFRWINPALGARSMHEILRERLLGEATLMDLSRREASGDSPSLIVNTTLYNNGRRFALTTLPSEMFRYDFVKDLQRVLQREGKSTEIDPLLQERWQHLLPMTPPDLHMNPCQVALSAAASASASFPPVIGPITFQVEGESTYWHAGDGGLYENLGAESILFLFLKQLQEKKARRALILAFDSSFPFSVGDNRLNSRSQPFGLFSFDFSRIPSIMEERAIAYRTLFFRSLQAQGVFPDSGTILLLQLRHTDAAWQPDLSDLPAACSNEKPPLQSPAEVRQRLAEIPTKLRVVSECDRQLLAASAIKVVAQNRQAILEFLEGSAPAPAP